MKLTTTTFVSLDGVMQGVGAPDEDRRGGFERGGWITPLFGKEAGAYLNLAAAEPTRLGAQAACARTSWSVAKVAL